MQVDRYESLTPSETITMVRNHHRYDLITSLAQVNVGIPFPRVHYLCMHILLIFFQD